MKKNSISCSDSSSGASPTRLLFAAWLFCAAILSASACRSVNETPLAAPTALAEQTPAAPAPTPTQTMRKKSALRLPRLEAALKKNIAARLNSWRASIEARDLEKNLQHYAEQVETYYLTSNTNRDFIRADRERAFKQFDALKLEIINVDINLEASDTAIITCDKSWDFKKGASFSNGLVQQEIQMRKIEKQWFITSEKDLQIYRYHNN